MAISYIEELKTKGHLAKEASKKLAFVSTENKNKALLNIANDLILAQEQILDANKQDCKEAEAAGMGTAMIDRLLLSPARLQGIASDVRVVASLPDPVGEFIDMRTLPNGLQIGRKRVPLGVIGAIYESRPNVTIDISSLCLKAGNAVILRCGREAFRSSLALVRVVQNAISKAGISEASIQFIESTDRAAVSELLKLREYIDLLIPRGGAEFIKFVVENATMPVVAGGVGVCHTFIDHNADIKKAVDIVYNAKVQRPTVCNALDTILVHSAIAERFLPAVAKELSKANVELHCDERSLKFITASSNIKVIPAVEGDWGKEFLALIAAVKVVDSLDEALKHIERYGSGHSEAIITEDYSNGMRFLNEVDAAAVYVNASTRFTDGGQYGLGAEVGISTQKFHARGPLGLRELTSYKWVIWGCGQVRL